MSIVIGLSLKVGTLLEVKADPQGKLYLGIKDEKKEALEFVEDQNGDLPQRVVSSSRVFSYLLTNFLSRARHHAPHLEVAVLMLAGAIWPTHHKGTMVPNIREGNYGRGCRFQHNHVNYYIAYDTSSRDIVLRLDNRDGDFITRINTSDMNAVERVKKLCAFFAPCKEARVLRNAMVNTLNAEGMSDADKAALGYTKLNHKLSQSEFEKLYDNNYSYLTANLLHERNPEVEYGIFVSAVLQQEI